VAGTYALEGALLVGGFFWYLRRRPPRTRGRWVGLGALIGLCVLIWASGPWAPPPPSPSAVAWVGMAVWLLPVWAGWADGGGAGTEEG